MTTSGNQPTFANRSIQAPRRRPPKTSGAPGITGRTGGSTNLNFDPF